MAEISELGESLVQRQRDRNDKLYKRSRNEAYKIGLATAGVGLANQMLEKKADQFMQSEQVLAQKAKYRAAASQAQSILTMEEQITQSGKSAEQFFLDTRYLPAMTEQFKTEFGEGYVPTSFMPDIVEQARVLAREEASRFTDALSAARSIPDYETALSSIDAIVMPPRNVGSSLLERVKGVFKGKSTDDFRQDAVARVRDQGLIKNETWDRLFQTVAEEDGIDAAVSFVKNMDRRGFDERTELDVETEVVADGEGGFNVITVRTAKNAATGGVEVTSQNRRIARPTTNDQEVVVNAQGVFQIDRVRGEEGVEVVDIKQKQLPTLETPESRREMAQALMQMNNPGKIAQELFTPAGLAELSNRMAEASVDLYDVRTPDDYARAVGFVEDLMLEQEYLIDKSMDTMRTEAYATVLGTMNSLLTELATTDPTAERAKELTDMISGALREANTALGSTRDAIQPFDQRQREQRGFVNPRVDWNTLPN